MSFEGLATQRTPRLDEPRILGPAAPNTTGTKGHVNSTNAQCSHQCHLEKGVFLAKFLYIIIHANPSLQDKRATLTYDTSLGVSGRRLRGGNLPIRGSECHPNGVEVVL